jgi:PRTRC genetic system protein B
MMSLFTPPEQIPLPTLEAILALIVHEGRDDTGHMKEYALTSHEITQTPGGIEVGPGRVLGARDHQTLLNVLLDTLHTDNEFLPPDVLSHSSGQLAWYVPGELRRMWLRDAQRTRGIKVPWPTLLFRARQGTLSLAALGSARRPRETDPLYHAPLMNVHASTRLCSGTAVLPRGNLLADRAGFETAVYETAFTHVNHEHTLRQPKNAEVSTAQHVRFWTQLARTGARRFPTRALVPLHLTVSQWLTQDSP